MLFSFFKTKIRTSLFTIAFYNLENLFDTIDGEDTLDGEFTPKGEKRWTTSRYNKKLYKIGNTISQIGKSTSEISPVLIGVAEVENKTVLNDLLNTSPIADINYGYEHYDSPDERGIDTALVYHKDFFTVIASEPIPLLIQNLNGDRDATRDILYVHGRLNGEEVHVFVNHWPSKREGNGETDYKRIEAAATIKRFMSKIEAEVVSPNYIIMGDFNDGPKAESIASLLETKVLFNPMENLITPKRGSANYKRKWSLFDQIIISHNFLNYEKGTHSFTEANVFDEHFLTEFKGKYKGNPFRTYVGKKYIGGYSDHFPVFLQLKYNK